MPGTQTKDEKLEAGLEYAGYVADVYEEIQDQILVRFSDLDLVTDRVAGLLMKSPVYVVQLASDLHTFRNEEDRFTKAAITSLIKLRLLSPLHFSTNILSAMADKIGRRGLESYEHTKYLLESYRHNPNQQNPFGVLTSEQVAIFNEYKRLASHSLRIPRHVLDTIDDGINRSVRCLFERPNTDFYWRNKPIPLNGVKAALREYNTLNQLLLPRRIDGAIFDLHPRLINYHLEHLPLIIPRMIMRRNQRLKDIFPIKTFDGREIKWQPVLFKYNSLQDRRVTNPSQSTTTFPQTPSTHFSSNQYTTRVMANSETLHTIMQEVFASNEHQVLSQRNSEWRSRIIDNPELLNNMIKKLFNTDEMSALLQSSDVNQVLKTILPDVMKNLKNSEGKIIFQPQRVMSTFAPHRLAASSLKMKEVAAPTSFLRDYIPRGGNITVVGSSHGLAYRAELKSATLKEVAGTSIIYTAKAVVAKLAAAFQKPQSKAYSRLCNKLELYAEKTGCSRDSLQNLAAWVWHRGDNDALKNQRRDELIAAFDGYTPLIKAKDMGQRNFMSMLKSLVVAGYDEEFNTYYHFLGRGGVTQDEAEALKATYCKIQSDWLNQFNKSMQAKDVSSAEKVAKKLKSVYPDEFSTCTTMCVLAISQGKQLEASKWYNQSLIVNREDARTLNGQRAECFGDALSQVYWNERIDLILADREFQLKGLALDYKLNQLSNLTGLDKARALIDCRKLAEDRGGEQQTLDAIDYQLLATLNGLAKESNKSTPQAERDKIVKVTDGVVARLSSDIDAMHVGAKIYEKMGNSEKLFAQLKQICDSSEVKPIDYLCYGQRLYEAGFESEAAKIFEDYLGKFGTSQEVITNGKNYDVASHLCSFYLKQLGLEAGSAEQVALTKEQDNNLTHAISAKVKSCLMPQAKASDIEDLKKLHYYKGDTDAAIKDFEAVLEYTNEQKTNLLKDKNSIDQKQLSKANEIVLNVTSELALLYFTKNPDKAKQLSDQVLKMDNKNAKGLYAKALVHYGKKEYQLSQANFENAQKQYLENGETENAAHAASMAKSVKDAKNTEIVQRAIKKLNEKVPAEQQGEQFDTVEDLLQEVFSDDAENVDAWRVKGYLHGRKEEHDESIASFKKAQDNLEKNQSDNKSAIEQVQKEIQNAEYNKAFSETRPLVELAFTAFVNPAIGKIFAGELLGVEVGYHARMAAGLWMLTNSLTAGLVAGLLKGKITDLYLVKMEDWPRIIKEGVAVVEQQCHQLVKQWQLMSDLNDYSMITKPIGEKMQAIGLRVNEDADYVREQGVRLHKHIKEIKNTEDFKTILASILRQEHIFRKPAIGFILLMVFLNGGKYLGAEAAKGRNDGVHASWVINYLENQPMFTGNIASALLSNALNFLTTIWLEADRFNRDLTLRAHVETSDSMNKHSDIAIAHMRNGQFQDSLDHFNDAIALFHKIYKNYQGTEKQSSLHSYLYNFAFAYFMLGYYQDKNVGDAISLLESLLREKPNDAKAVKLMGVIYLILAETKQVRGGASNAAISTTINIDQPLLQKAINFLKRAYILPSDDNEVEIFLYYAYYLKSKSTADLNKINVSVMPKDEHSRFAYLLLKIKAMVKMNLLQTNDRGVVDCVGMLQKALQFLPKSPAHHPERAMLLRDYYAANSKLSTYISSNSNNDITGDNGSVIHSSAGVNTEMAGIGSEYKSLLAKIKDRNDIGKRENASSQFSFGQR